MHVFMKCVAVAWVCSVGAFLPADARAQERASIVGQVVDATGAVLPGVTVEAASPALIEQARTAITDGNGRFAIIDLRPGIYTVTFSLPGFRTVKREGIELAGAFTAQVNGAMAVGQVEETVTVSSTAPTASDAFTCALNAPSSTMPSRLTVLKPGSEKVTV